MPTDVTPADRAGIRQILAPSYADEIELIRMVQQRVLDASPLYHRPESLPILSPLGRV